MVSTELPPASPTASPIGGELDQRIAVTAQAKVAKDEPKPTSAAQVVTLGELNMRGAYDGGIVQGVAPVALPLPAYHRSVVITRELVTRDRPLSLGLLYVTTAGLAPLIVLWLACIAWLARLYAADLRRLLRMVRERLARRPEGEPVAPVPAAPPPVVA
jgi:hypothetical protein